MFGSTEHVGYRRMEGMDHVYVKDSSLISNLQPNETVIGDHKLITMTINETKVLQEISYRRDWHKYNKECLCVELSIKQIN